MRPLVIDADHLLYAVAGNPSKDSLDGEILQARPNMKMLKRKFKSLVKEIENEVAVETVSKKFTLGETLLVFSDPRSNFRYDLYPEYKANRAGLKKSDAFYKLRDWALRHYIMVEGCEADDIVAYYVRNGAVGASTDKDLLQGVPGRWFDAYHSRRTYSKVKKRDAKKFTLLQTLAGDPTDNIKGLPRVGLPTAEKLLNRLGYTWDGVVAAYAEKGMTEDDAILTRRLIGMDQFGHDGLDLWKP